MKIKYFADTDTLLLTFNDNLIIDSVDVGENTLIELDADGKVVSMTIEHAGQQINLNEFTYQLAAA